MLINNRYTFIIHSPTHSSFLTTITARAQINPSIRPRPQPITGTPDLEVNFDLCTSNVYNKSIANDFLSLLLPTSN